MSSTDGLLDTETLNIDDPDGFYHDLIDLHRGLSDEESAIVNWRLILLLANQVGGEGARAAMRAARLKRT
jgi:hypothetical protein